MQPFAYERATDLPGLVAAMAAATHESDLAPPMLLAGGTTLIDLMKLNVMQPETLLDINPLAGGELGRIEVGDGAVRLGALVTMAQAADHPQIRRLLPVVAQSLDLAASAQLRNMASLGGNVLQRTRCSYFRDVSYAECNKRSPGSGCAARNGINRQHAILGTSEHCIAAYPGDFAQALIALDATVTVAGPDGPRALPFAELHRPPADTPHLETRLRPGDIITAFVVPLAPWLRRSLYLKIRDRESYEFALASAAVALDLQGGEVREARIALGGAATVPWRARAAEAALKGRSLAEAAAGAAEIAFAAARPRDHNAFKAALGRATLIRALHQAAAMEI